MKPYNSYHELDVSSYSDSELLNILSLTSPTDRELEARIIQMIHRYSNKESETSIRYQNFYRNIYKRFFDVESGSDNDGEEGFEDDAQSNSEDGNVVEGLENMNATAAPAANPEPPNNATRIQDNVALTRPLDYSKDQLNPLLKQVIKRTVSIDSQFRNRQFYKLPTNFAFNLSEPLRDVVALRLYSIQIPYTWFTVSNNYGGNVIYIKGNSPGIDNDNYNFSVGIPPGNYSQTDIITGINGSIDTLMKQRLDISFGNGNYFSYNTSTVFTTANITINNTFNELGYNLTFANVGYTTIDADRYGSGNTTAKLNAFLGFNNAVYNINRIYSTRNISTAPPDVTQTIYSIDGSNNTIRIVQYKYTDINTSNSYKPENIVSEFQVIIPQGVYSESSLYNQINNSIQSNPYLDTSISKFNKVIIPDISMANYGFAYYELVIQLLRNSSKFISGDKTIKTAVILPNDINIWVGTSSLFRFDISVNELNIVRAETSSVQNDFYANTDQYLIFRCIHPGYTNSSGNIAQYASLPYNNTNLHIFKNDIKVALTYSNKITLNNFLNNINNAILTTNNVSKNLNQNSAFGVFNTATTTVNVDITNTFHFLIDVNNIFNNMSYKVSFNTDMLGSAFSSFADVSLNVYSGTNTNTHISTFRSNFVDITNFNIGTDPTNPANILTIYPQPTANNADDSPWNIYLYSSAQGDQTATNIQSAITSFYYNGAYPLKNTTVLYNTNDSTFTVNLSINNVLTQNDYVLTFYNGAGNATWEQVYIYSNYEYQISSNTNITDISGYLPAPGKNFVLLEDTSFTLSSIYDAIAEENNITIHVPAKTYTRATLLDAINTDLSNNPLTSGSYMYVYFDPVLSKEFIYFKVNIAKIYTAKDYRLVYYDLVSFVKCYVGSNSVRNSSWDSTLGWTLGFRNTEYDLSEYVSSDGGSAVVVSESSLDIFPYKYFYIILDDYNQSRLNDGLITLSMAENVIAQPSYAPVQSFVDDCTGNKVFIGSDSKPLTTNQIYSANQIYADSRAKQSGYSSTPFLKDVFGIIPIKPGPAGSNYVEFGGTLQNQERLYFGPVNIFRMSIKLIDDRGDVVDLNNNEWSFSFICEQLYRSDA